MAFPPTDQNSAPSGDFNGPEQDPNFVQGGAPAGPFFGADLPVSSVHGGPPATTGGFTPDPGQDQLPPPGSSEGCGKCPTGLQR